MPSDDCTSPAHFTNACTTCRHKAVHMCAAASKAMVLPLHVARVKLACRASCTMHPSLRRFLAQRTDDDEQASRLACTANMPNRAQKLLARSKMDHTKPHLQKLDQKVLVACQSSTWQMICKACALLTHLSGSSGRVFCFIVAGA